MTKACLLLLQPYSFHVMLVVINVTAFSFSNYCLWYFQPWSANLVLVLKTSNLCTILSRLRMGSSTNTYCWICLFFLVISDIWLAVSIQVFRLKVPSKLTDSIWLRSQFFLIILFSLKLTLQICAKVLSYSHSLAHSVFPGSKLFMCPSFYKLTLPSLFGIRGMY